MLEVCKTIRIRPTVYLVNQSSGKIPKVFASRFTLTTWKLTPIYFFRVSQKRAWTIPWACLTTEHNWSVLYCCALQARALVIFSRGEKIGFGGKFSGKNAAFFGVGQFIVKH